MQMRRLSDDIRRQICETYEAWNPWDGTTGTVDDIAREYGISKQTVYNVLADSGIEKKSRRNPRPARTAPVRAETASDPVKDLLADALSEPLLTVLLQKLLEHDRILTELAHAAKRLLDSASEENQSGVKQALRAFEDLRISGRPELLHPGSEGLASDESPEADAP